MIQIEQKLKTELIAIGQTQEQLKSSLSECLKFILLIRFLFSI